MCPLSNSIYYFISYPLHQDSVFVHRPCSVAPVELQSREVNSTGGQAVSSPWSDVESDQVPKRSLRRFCFLDRYEVPNETSCENVFQSHTVMGRYYCMETITLHFSYKIKGGNTVSKTSNLFEQWHGVLPGRSIKRQFRRTKGEVPLSPDLFSSWQCPTMEREQLWNQMLWGWNPDSAIRQRCDPWARDSVSWNSVYSPVKPSLCTLPSRTDLRGGNGIR